MFCFDGETQIALPDAEVALIPSFYDADTSTELFDKLGLELCWEQETIKLYGKQHPVPRLTALYGDCGLSYTYSGIGAQAKPWTSLLLQIKRDIEHATHHQFNSVLANLYRNGQDSNGWHADNEPGLGRRPVIAPLSLGASRDFQFKHRQMREHRYSWAHAHGSLLVMAGDMQAHWLHSIPKRRRARDARINLTFRTILASP